MPSKATGTRKARTTNRKTSDGNGKRLTAAVAHPAPGTTDVLEQVRRRAYELYEQRGRQDGYHEQDWLQAEAELLSRSA